MLRHKLGYHVELTVKSKGQNESPLWLSEYKEEFSLIKNKNLYLNYDLERSVFFIL